MKINFDDIMRKFESKANSIYLDNKRLKDILEEVKEKVENNKQLKEIIDDIKLLISLVKDWLRGEYKDLSKSSLIMIIVSFIYLLTPFDIIPDFIIGGFVDDIAVITYVIKKISEELKRYKEWKSKINSDGVVKIEGKVIDIDDSE